MKKYSILVMGAYGCGNKGDDAILESLCNMLAPDFNVVATCGKKNNLSWLNIKTTRCRLNRGMSLSVLALMCIDVFKILFHLLCCRAVIFGGGSLLHDRSAYNLPFWFFFQRIAKLFGKQTYYVSMGVGPISTDKGKKLCKKHLPLANHIYVRDKNGYGILKVLGLNNVTLTADLAMAMETDLEAAKPILKEFSLQAHSYVCVTLCKHFNQDNYYKKSLNDTFEFDEEKTILAEAFEKIYKKYKLPFVFLPTDEMDYELGLEISDRLKNVCKFFVLGNQYNARQFSSVVASAKYLIGVRMHSMVFAARACVPFFALVYDPKVKAFLEMTKMNPYYLDIENINVDEICLMFDKMADNETVTKENLRMVTSELSQSVYDSIIAIKEKIT